MSLDGSTTGLLTNEPARSLAELWLVVTFCDESIQVVVILTNEMCALETWYQH